MKRYEIYALNLFLIMLLLAVPRGTYAHELKQKTGKTMTESSIFENRQEKHQKFHEMLQGIKDEKKRDAIERVDTNLAAINKHYTTMLMTVLSKFEAILTRIIEKTHVLADGGTNTAAIDADITDAETAISEAKDAVTAQSQKDYTLSITSETTLKEVAVAMREQLHADLKVAKEAVQQAHKAVKLAAHTLYETKKTH